MKKAPLYSRSRGRMGPPAAPTGPAASREALNATSAPNSAAFEVAAAAGPRVKRPSRLRAYAERHRLVVTAMLAALLVLGGALAGRALIATPVPLTQRDIDAAVRQSLEK